VSFPEWVMQGRMLEGCLRIYWFVLVFPHYYRKKPVEIRMEMGG
jgi:hypothetical protein